MTGIFSEVDALDTDNISLMEVDLEGNIIWEGLFGDEYGQIGRQDIVQLPNGDLAFSYIACPVPSCFSYTDSVRMAVTLVNADGQKKWTSDFTPFGDYVGVPPNGPIVAIENGGFVVGAERNSWSPTSLHPPILVWLDSMGNVTQQYNFHDDFALDLNDLMVTSDGTIIGCGRADLLDFDFGLGGWVFAFNQTGELLWERYIVDQFYPNQISWFNAAEETPAGGLALVGSIRTPTQYDIWFVKLDSTGCLSPDCDDIFDILSHNNTIRKTNTSYSISPNPTSNYIHINSSNSIFLNNASIFIFNSTGNKIMEIPYSEKIDLSDVSSGMYFLKIMDEEKGEIWSEKIIVP